MDSFYTILLYIGALVLIGLVKSISKAGKKRPVATNRTFSAFEEAKEEENADFNSIFNFLQEEPVLPKIEKKPKKNRALSPALSVQNEAYKPIKTSSDTSATRAEKEETFIFGKFDLPAAIVYSEILKKPDY